MSKLTQLFNRFKSFSQSKKIAYIILGILVIFFAYLLVVTIFKKPQKLAVTERTAKYYEPASYVSGQVIVKYKAGFSPGELEQAIGEREKKQRSIGGKIKIFWRDNIQKQMTPQEYLSLFQELDKQAGVTYKEKLFKDSKDPMLRRHYLLKLKSGSDAIIVQNLYLKYGFIEGTQPNFIDEIFATTPDDLYYPQMWGLQKIQMSDAWDAAKGSKSVTAAVIDTGIDYTHQDLPDDIIKGKNFISGSDDPRDDKGHGTHVAGTIGALANNKIGVSGINWDLKLMAVKVLGSGGSGPSSGIVQGIRYAVDNGARVINMSLGGARSCDFLYQDAINYALSKGVVVVVAAGNSNADASGFSPASCSGVVTVAATGPNDQRAYYSNHGSVVELAAPGGDKKISGGVCTVSSCIISTVPGGGYSYNYQGTSMASPHVAGAAALVLFLYPNLTPQQVSDCLVASADPISTDKPIDPRLNVFKALQACSSGAPPGAPTPTLPPGVPTPTPTLPPGVTPTPTTPAQSTPTPTGGGSGGSSPTPTPTPIKTYNCVVDPNCPPAQKVIQQCQLICTPS